MPFSSTDRRPALGRRLRSLVYVVRDESMEPTLSEGDRLLVDPRAYLRAAPVAGELVALWDPERPRSRLVKRVGAAPIPGASAAVPAVFLVGDNLAHSRDSRAFGPVPLTSLIGKVWYRTAPAVRAGPL